MSKLSLLFARLADYLAGEPVLTVTLIDGIFALAVALGLPVNLEVKAAVITLVTILGQLYARSQVSPISGQPVPVPAAPSA